jgi:hypothetical protein
MFYTYSYSSFFGLLSLSSFVIIQQQAGYLVVLDHHSLKSFCLEQQQALQFDFHLFITLRLPNVK